MTAVLGIDPGLSGALAVIRGPELLVCVDMPVEATGSAGRVKNRVCCAQAATLVRQWRAQWPGELIAVVEAVASMPGQGVAGMFSLGDSAGAIRGVLQALGVRVEFVAPARWKRAMGLGRDKGHARTLAMQRLPQHASLFARVRDDGRAEATLIAMWGWQTWG